MKVKLDVYCAWFKYKEWLLFIFVAPCPNVTCPGEGFQGKDCKCYCKGNPIQECANDSQEVDDSKLVSSFY